MVRFEQSSNVGNKFFYILLLITLAFIMYTVVNSDKNTRIVDLKGETVEAGSTKNSVNGKKKQNTGGDIWKYQSKSGSWTFTSDYESIPDEYKSIAEKVRR